MVERDWGGRRNLVSRSGQAHGKQKHASCVISVHSTSSVLPDTKKVICPLSVLLEKESRRVSVIQGGQGVGEAVGVHKRLDVLVQQGATIGGRVLQLSVAGVDGHPDARRRTEEDGVQAALVQHRQVCCVLQSVQQAQHEGVVRQLGISCRARRLAAVTWGLDEAPHR